MTIIWVTMFYMTQISRDTVLRLASLSSLQLNDDEVDSLTSDMQRIVGYIEQLDELDTEGVEPTYSTVDHHNIWREDEVKIGSVTREGLLKLAPAATNNQIKVPKVL